MSYNEQEAQRKHHEARGARPTTYNRPKKESKPKGHEAFLKALETSGAQISVEFNESLPSDPLFISGVVKHSDSFTISLETEGTTTVIFKHSIRSFTCLTPREE